MEREKKNEMGLTSLESHGLSIDRIWNECSTLNDAKKKVMY